MARFHLRTSEDFDQLLNLFFDAYPEMKVKRDRMAEETDVQENWMALQDMPLLVDWSRELDYISTQQGQTLMTTARRLLNAYYNAQQRAD